MKTGTPDPIESKTPSLGEPAGARAPWNELRSPQVWAITFGVWTFIALFTATVRGTFYATENLTWGESFALSLCDEWVSALVTPLLLWLGRRWRVDGTTWMRNLPLQVLACSIVALCAWVLSNAASHVVALAIHRPAWQWDVAVQEFVGGYLLCALIVGAIAVFAQGFHYYREYLERERRALQLETQLARAELQVLRMQINPHFLFNTLHAVTALMSTDVRGAERTLTLLGDLLRRSLADDGVQEVPLEHELDFVGRYLEIEQMRLGERLSVTLDIEPECRDVLVPNLVLHPLVENAVRHGISRRATGGHIVIRARRDGDALELEVEDDGPGFGARKSTEGFGIGLANTRERLERLHPGRHTFTPLEREQGACILLRVPWRAASTAQVRRFARAR